MFSDVELLAELLDHQALPCAHSLADRGTAGQEEGDTRGMLRRDRGMVVCHNSSQDRTEGRASSAVASSLGPSLEAEDIHSSSSERLNTLP
jgi:hypothetical protein